MKYLYKVKFNKFKNRNNSKEKTLKSLDEEFLMNSKGKFTIENKKEKK